MKLKNSIKKIALEILKHCAIRKITAQISILDKSNLLKGRTALITGGSRGIGFDIAKSFLKAGANVIVTGRKQGTLDKACQQLKQYKHDGCSLKALVMDVSDINSVRKSFTDYISGGGNLDILVNNAGMMGKDILDVAEFEQLMKTNMEGTYFLTKMFANYLINNHTKKGNILNILSSSSFRPATTPYAISKWGLRGFTIGIARQLAPHNIVVNAIAPGPTATDMLGKGNADDIKKPNSLIGRYVLPEEIGNMAAILVSDMCRTTVGEILCMTGGSGNVTNEDIKF